MVLTDNQLQKFKDYKKANKSLFSDRVIQDFFQDVKNIKLFVRAQDGEVGSQKELEERFQKHFFRMRFIKFLASTIKFCAIDQMRQYQKNDFRYMLIFDQPCSEEGDVTLGEILLGKHNIEYESVIVDSSQFQSSMMNEHLYQAFSALSQKQKLITTLCYSLCYQDKEIARMIGVSPQAVSKTRKLALQKMHHKLTERGW